MTYDTKLLTQLVKFCRKQGIQTFKGEGFEFTLTDYTPTKRPYNAIKRKLKETPISESSVISDVNAPSEEDMLFWSTQTHSEVSES